MGSGPVFRMTSIRRSQSGKSQSITTASNCSRAIASSTDSSLPRNFGCKPRSSTIRPNSAATISSRATISTLSNTANQKRTQPYRQLTDLNDSLARRPYLLDILGNKCPPLQTRERVGETICPIIRESSLRKHDERAADSAHGSAQATRWSNAGACRSSEAGRPGSA